jgi:hypothetical protein
MSPRAQKLQLCTNFRGRTDRHLRGVSVLIRDQMAVLLRLCDATLCHQGTPRTALTICLPPIKKSWDFVLKRFNYAPFSRSHGSSFARRVGHYSRPNGVPTMFVRRHIVSSRLYNEIFNHFLAFDKKFMRFRAQKVQLCTIFEVARIVNSAACWSLFETKWRSNYVCAKPQCVIQALQWEI